MIGNEIKDFEPGSEWDDGTGIILTFHSVNPKDGTLLFSSDTKEYWKNDEGLIPFMISWRDFKQLEKV